jgi:glutamate dehydrogenase
MKGRFSTFVSPLEARVTEARIAELTRARVPLDVAEDVAILPLLGAAPEVVLLAETEKIPVDKAAQAYFGMGALIGLDRLRALAGTIVSTDHWDRLALRRITDDLYMAQRLLAAEALQRSHSAKEAEGLAAVRAWAKLRKGDVEQTANFLAQLERGGEPSIAKLSLANSQVQKMAAR